MVNTLKEMKVLPENKKTIYLAGGCFWGVEGYFQRINGVLIQKLDMQMERQMIQITSISGLQIMQRLSKLNMIIPRFLLRKFYFTISA